MESRNLFGEKSQLGTMTGTRVQRRQQKLDNINTWTGLSLVKAVMAIKYCSQWRTIIHDAAKPLTTKFLRRVK